MNRIERARQMRSEHCGIYISEIPTWEQIGKKHGISAKHCLAEIAAYEKYEAKLNRIEAWEGRIEIASYIQAFRRHGASGDNWGEISL